MAFFWIKLTFTYKIQKSPNSKFLLGAYRKLTPLFFRSRVVLLKNAYFDWKLLKKLTEDNKIRGNTGKYRIYQKISKIHVWIQDALIIKLKIPLASYIK